MADQRPPVASRTIRVLFVCMGNICRSPTAEGVFRSLVESQELSEHFDIDSAGTHAYHVGNPPDVRAQELALQRGVDLSQQRARQICEDDFEAFDHILAMDQSNLENLYLWCSPEYRYKLSLFLDYAPNCGLKEVPDPYYGGVEGFHKVFDLIQDASSGLLKKLRLDYSLD
ncbi:MAG: low molecular weight phosphotyrosine protein phosphatase [Gammaproteobacteria bacterium]|nr:MAG: low molecular weight phosphotyrosine protein phosphatase [Gammaproteobacteria bacterium]